MNHQELPVSVFADFVKNEQIEHNNFNNVETNTQIFKYLS